jgi:hypothetical protein
VGNVLVFVQGATIYIATSYSRSSAFIFRVQAAIYHACFFRGRRRLDFSLNEVHQCFFPPSSAAASRLFRRGRN